MRSTNTGISTFVDATGRVNATTRIEDPEILIADVAMLPGGTLYSSIGNLFVWLLALSLVLERLLFRLRARRRRQS